MYRIRKEFRFEAAHTLPNHNGKCKNLHGHSYRFEVFVVGNMPLRPADHPKEGMLIDFYDVSVVAKEIIDLLDHTFLNDTAKTHLDIDVTTAENLAHGLFGFFDRMIGRHPVGSIHVEKVRVWETANAYAEYTG